MSSKPNMAIDPVVVQEKAAAASVAAERLEDGMIVGLGSGSTAALAVAAIGKRVKQGLRIVGIPTSEQTAEQSRQLGIPLATFADYSKIDIAIDGADEVEIGTLNLIKGGGGNQLREKIVANVAARFIIVVDEGKIVQQLGSHRKVPVEVAQFGWQATARILSEMNAHPELRLNAEKKPFVTDGGNYILDCAVGPIKSAGALATELNNIVGVVEHGLFLGMASEVLIGGANGVKSLSKAL
jgi:ribose 5-phosphate isomerase A